MSKSVANDFVSQINGSFHFFFFASNKGIR